MDVVSEQEASRRRPVGRPRLLTKAKVIEAAAMMPPAELTMTRLAERLGVSVGTLYQYVADRDELVRLVIGERMRALPLPEDTGQHWSQYLREYVAILTAMLSADPKEMVQVLGIESTLEPELRLTEAFYAALVRRGFALEDAVVIHTQLSVIAVGTAVGNLREGLAVRDAGSVTAALARVLDGLDPADMPLIRDSVPAYLARMAAIEGLIEALIGRIARSCGQDAGTVSSGTGSTSSGHAGVEDG
jgi:AcrR family transcriptional regulator